VAALTLATTFREEVPRAGVLGAMIRIIFSQPVSIVIVICLEIWCRIGLS